MQCRPKVVYAFPHAGATAACYRLWSSQQNTASRTTIVPLDVPGRGAFVRMRPIPVLRDLIEWLGKAILADLSTRGGAEDVDWLTFGHSYGGVLSFAVGVHLASRLGVAPKLAIVSGAVAPQVQLADDRHLMPIDKILDKARRDNNTPEAVLSDPILGRRVVEQLRADYTIRAQFPELIGLEAQYPIVYVRGDDDEYISDACVDAWRAQAARSFDLVRIQGGHFAVYDNWPLVQSLLWRD